VPLLLLPLAILIVIGVSVLLLPWSILQRYRAGTARRRARSWVALLNVFGIAVSAGIFLTTTAISSVWVPGAFANSSLGFVAGCALGVVGLWLTLWERDADALYYTPNRWLVLAITFTVAARLCYGFWRGWHAWQSVPQDASWLAASGLSGSFAAGAIVLGYYQIFWIGVWSLVRTSRGKP
jgi:hypothetical protein